MKFAEHLKKLMTRTLTGMVNIYLNPSFGGGNDPFRAFFFG